MTIQPDSTFWSPDDDRMLDIWIEHGYPTSNDVVHLLDVAVRLRNRVRQWQGIANELIEATGRGPESKAPASDQEAR